MIIIGDVPVLPSHFGPSLYTKKGFDYYRTLTDMLHAQGCKVCAQLHQSDSNLKGMIRYIPVCSPNEFPWKNCVLCSISR